MVPRGVVLRIASPLVRRGAALSTCRRLREATLNLPRVVDLNLSRSEDLVCKNMMCEKVGEVCVCKLAVWASQSAPSLLNLETLNLSQNGLTVLPDSIFELTTVIKLDISENKLTNIPDAIGRMTSLKYLDLYGNSDLEALPVSLYDPCASGLLDLNEIRLCREAGTRFEVAARESGWTVESTVEGEVVWKR
jgi:Leucine-rich repeat (LRR) protein